MDPGGISLLGPDECDGQEDVKEWVQLGSLDPARDRKRGLKRWMAQCQCLNSLWRHLCLLLGYKGKPGAAGLLISESKCRWENSSQEFSSTFRAPEVPAQHSLPSGRGMNKQEAALQSLQAWWDSSKNKPRFPPWLLLSLQRFSRKNLFPSSFAPSCRSPVFTFRDFIPLKMTPNCDFPLLRWKLNLTGTGIRSRG